ncbi:hypothetical protein GCU67_04895 [Modestobacter muralis]|uniref:Tissue inhibitor of metalloproteinase n=1 Tax=Modestobacter muralis TaxID=1608614 RepID=A0A6P0ERS5_9ACTN|nr:hypothetical protein [Modestobacter muralis]NEK93513.1 hypothetical protein [Modestobacter muralis]NEN50280.1 hypothetical protein [Modestobacter muralis]
MRRLVVLVLGAFVLLTAGWVVAPAASACSCAPASIAEQVERADVVFTGTLVSREVLHPVPGVVGSDDPALHVFAVQTLLKGTASALQEVVSADSSASCGLALDGDGPFLVHATDPPGGPEGRLTASLCGGTAPADADLVAEVQALTGGAVPEQPSGPVIGMAEGSSTTTVAWLVAGLVGLTVLVGGLAALAGRRADRRALTVVVLTRD